MQLDPDTLLVVNVANLLVVAAALPLIMGATLSAAARDARRALMVQALGWIALILSGLWPGEWPDMILSSLAMVAIGVANWLLFLSLNGWLGPRRFRRTLAALVIGMPIGYALFFSSYPLRVGWANLLIAAQVLIVAYATLNPRSSLGGRWRWVMCGCLVVMAFMTAGRGILGAWFTELYPHFTAPHPFNLAALFAANITLVLMNVSVLVAWRIEAEQQLHTQAITDPLTGVLNRRGWSQGAAHLLAQAHRHHVPLTLIAIDLDHFKRINDSRGHEIGDAALRLFGRLLADGQRSGDLIARLGGEEFFALLPHTDATAGKGFDQRLRGELARAAPAELGFALDFSSGLAVLTAAETLEGLMSRADAALYRAKDNGRGHLVVDEGS
jgi:diguanylate cyclase (GGDEF)-like protein